MCVDAKCDCADHADGDARRFKERLEDWVMSQKMCGNLSQRDVELFNQAIEDVEVGSW